MSDISSANLVAAITIGTLYPVPQLLEQFYVDDAFTIEAVDEAQTIMGVDGFMAVGYTPSIIPMTINFLASSPSITIFDVWRASNKAARQAFLANMTLQYPSIGKSYTFSNGALVRPKNVPDAKAILQNQSFMIHWNHLDVTLL